MSLSQPIIDFVLVLIGVEFVALLFWLRRVGRLDLVLVLISFLLSGTAILGALRFAIAIEVNQAAALALLSLSFPLHLLTLVLVWRLAQQE